jgi:pyruvate formate lyase activating enzyme
MIKGVTNLSLIDWDGEVCATLFLGGCNLKCKFCQNKSLVLSPSKLKDINIYSILETLKYFKKYLTGVCITGGEPLMQRLDIVPLFRSIKDMGLKVKLDTNGFYPMVLDYYLKEKLIDYIAMDIKAPLLQDKYSKICGRKLSLEDLSLVQKSIDLIRSSGINYEFRTTVVPNFHTFEDIEDICKYSIKGANRYILQNFRSCDTLLNPTECPDKGFTQTELEAFATIARQYIKEVKIRNYNNQNP